MWQSGRKGKGRGREGKGRKGRSKRAALLRWRGGGVRQSAIMTLLLVVSKIRFYSEVGAEWSILRFWKSSTFPLVVVLVVLMEEHGQNCLLRTESRNLVIFQPRIEVGCQVHLGRCFSAPYVCLWGSGGPVRCVTPPFVGLDVQINDSSRFVKTYGIWTNAWSRYSDQLTIDANSAKNLIFLLRNIR
jgi:hypothetical protein